MTQTIQNVSDTAFMVAGCRAAESERQKPLFRDPLAAKLVCDRGEKILATVPGRLWHKVAAHRTSVGHRRADALPCSPRCALMTFSDMTLYLWRRY